MALPPYSNEVYLDWSDESNQNAMRAALQKVEGELGKSYPLIIGGKEVETDGEILSVNPPTPRNSSDTSRAPPSVKQTWP